MSRRAKPRTDMHPQMGDPAATLEAMMGMMMGQLTGDDSFLPGSSEGCMETQWRGLPARDLFLAAHQGRVQDLKDLLLKPENRKRVNDWDNDGCGILHCYALNGEDEGEDTARGIIDALVDAGYDVNTRSKSTKETPLLYATIYSRHKIVAALLNRGARVDLTDWRGKAAGPTAREKCKHNGTGEDKCCTVLQLIQKAEEEQRKDTTLQDKAEKLRQRGNVEFQKGKYEKARNLYTQSLEILEDHRTFANRALCALNLGKQLLSQQRPNYYPRTIVDWGQEAMSDASKAMEMDPSSTKAHFRYTLGQAMSRDFPRAKNGARDGLKACPGNEELEEVLSVFNEWKVPDCFTNPFSDHARQANQRVNAGEPWEPCRFCRGKIPLSFVEETSCPFCAMDIDTDVTEAEIVAFIMEH